MAVIITTLQPGAGGVGAILSAVGGIMVADHYLLRRRRLDVPALFDPEGPFRFANGFNPAGLIAWLVGGGMPLPLLEYAYAVGASRRSWCIRY